MKVEFVNAKIPAVCDKLNCIDKNVLSRRFRYPTQCTVSTNDVATIIIDNRGLSRGPE